MTQGERTTAISDGAAQLLKRITRRGGGGRAIHGSKHPVPAEQIRAAMELTKRGLADPWVTILGYCLSPTVLGTALAEAMGTA